MTARITQGGASVPSNVVRLPTAAPRKVHQRWNRQTRELFEELPKFPDKRAIFARWPWMRKAMEQARLIEQVNPTPELMIVTAMFRLLPEMEQWKAQALIACMGLQSPLALQAAAWLGYAGGKISYADKRDIERALKMLANGEAE